MIAKPKCSGFAHVNLTVDSYIQKQAASIIYSQGENLSSDYRNHLRSIIEQDKKQKELLGLGEDNSIHVSSKEINETLDKWIIDARSRFQDGTIEDIAEVTKKYKHYTDVVNSQIATHRVKVEEEKNNKAIIESTNTHKRIEELQEELRLKNEEVERLKQEQLKKEKPRKREEQELTN